MGGSIALAILNGHYSFPLDKEQDDPYSDEFKDFIRFLLVVDPKDRPDIHLVSHHMISSNYIFMHSYIYHDRLYQGLTTF